MRQSVFHRLSSALWAVIVVFIVLLAIYVSTGRMLTSLTGAYQREILQELNHRVPFFIDADKVRAEWHSFTPVLVLEGLRLTLPGQARHSVELSEGRIALDVVGSLRTRSLQLTQLRLGGLALAGEVDAAGQLFIRGFEGGDTAIGEWLQEFLLNVERVLVDDARLTLALPDAEQRHFNLDLALSREGSHRKLRGKLSSSRGFAARAIAEGLGDPFEPETFTGQLYLDIAASDVGALTDLLGDPLPGVQVDGGLDLKVWSSWDHGEVQSRLRLGMDNAVVAAADGAWQLPFDRVAFDAGLEQRSAGWHLDLATLALARGDHLLEVPRLQLDIRGQGLELRAQSIPLAPLGDLLAGAETLPPAIVDLVSVLQPRGAVPTLQLNIGDVSAPLEDWLLQANFHELVVNSWHGAPGITGGSGYARLEPGSGLVLLDSRQFSMDFPTVYAEPLRFDKFNGTVHIDWDENAVTLSSDLIEAKAEEGRLAAKFGLSIPLQASEVGLEMDLLVGIRNTRTVWRGKYIPYILDENLRSWLEASIVDGLVEEGGFVWRGSLTSESAAHHTVQLFFNTRDTALRYHPDWPALADANATVLISDSKVSVWADRASLLGFEVDRLSVEVSAEPLGPLWLAVDASLGGPAADGLRVINESPLARYVGNALADAAMTGRISTDLAILMDLDDDNASPKVEVSTRFSDVELDLSPAGLSLVGICGTLDYSSAAGFSSRNLVGELWGEPVQASVGQRDLPAQAGDGSTVVVELTTEVEMKRVQQWLDLDWLDFAQGRTPAVLKLEVAPDQEPLLTIDSLLVGIELDLPAPWGKPAEIERQVQFRLALGSERLMLDIDMDGGLAAQLELVDGKLEAAALALDHAPLELTPALVRIGGRMAYADIDQWQRFLSRYLDGSAESQSDTERTLAPGEGPVLTLAVDELQVDQLVVGDQTLGAVTLGLSQDSGNWLLTAQADWLRGQLRHGADGQSALDIRYLDLAGLDEIDLPAADEAQVIEVPDLAVVIEELRDGEVLLGDLAFDLRSEGADLHAQNISGRIAAMQIRSDDPARITWHQGPGGRTELDAGLYFGDLGQTLQQFGYEQVVVTQEGSFRLGLEWPGGPQDFALRESEGSLRVDIGAGHFPEAPGGASGALRVVSILNLAEIVQKLSLSHMFESGIPFSKVNGEVFFHAGTIEVANMVVEGGASSFQFSGVSEVESRALDGELVLTLPVAHNLPWVAALTAGLPVAAGVYVLSKLFESQVNRLTSAVYTATGTWDDPEVEFDRVFDDTVAPGAAGKDGPSALVVPAPPASAQSGSP